MRRVTAIAGAAVLAWGLIFGDGLFAATVPPGFTETVISGPWANAVGIAFEDNGRMYVWEGTGQIWFKDPGDANYTLLLDIHDEVGKWGDHGMLGFALDPDFRVNGYIYVFYVVDRYYLFHSGDPDYDPNANEYNAATIGRLTRYTCRSADGFRSVDPASRQTTDIGGAQTGSFAPQALADGIIRPKEDVGAFRAQLVDSLNGKVLRIDSATGNGLHAHVFGRWGCASRFAWACGPIRVVIFRPTVTPGSCTLGMLVGVIWKHWTW